MTSARLIPLLAGFAACGLAERPWHATPAQLAPMPPQARPASEVGPLAIAARAAETSWPEQQRLRRLTDDHYLDRARIHAETTAFLAVVDTFYRPHTAETRIGFDQAHRELTTLENLAPYSVFSVSLAFLQSTERLHLCIAPAGMSGSCDRDLAPRPPWTGPLFEVGEAAPGIATLTLHDLADAADPRWRGFAEATAPLASARGLVLDLRDAPGADPRAVLPWVAALAGPRALAPLRAIERPAEADGYVAAYAARFRDRGRDAAIWRALVGPDAHAEPARALPIAIVVGRSCQAACELIARTLETYAGATVTGGVGRSGRLARDEPALLELPHSQTAVYFHATHYLLAADIEAATGPSEEWHVLLAGDPVVDQLAFAVRDVAQRLGGGWPRCDALPTTPNAKLHGVTQIPQGCPAGLQILLQSDAPPSALGRFLSTCPAHVDAHGLYPGIFDLRFAGPPTIADLARIAASELVADIRVACAPQLQID